MNRRNFIRNAAGAAALLTVTPAAIAEVITPVLPPPDIMYQLEMPAIVREGEIIKAVCSIYTDGVYQGSIDPSSIQFLTGWVAETP